jgi:heme-degrading monooxygenase HmoA
MITRVFIPTIRPGREEDFELFLRETAIPLVSQQPGLVTQNVGRRHAPCTTTDYLYLSVWEDVGAIRAFAGENWQQAVITPDEAHLLEHAWIGHYNDLLRPGQLGHPR